MAIAVVAALVVAAIVVDHDPVEVERAGAALNGISGDVEMTSSGSIGLGAGVPAAISSAVRW